MGTKPVEPATGSDPASGNAKPAKPAAPGAPSRKNPKASKGTASVWGHVVMARPEKSMEKFAKRLVPPMLAPMAGPDQLKSMVGMQFEGRADVVKHIDLTQPAGCAIANPKEYDRPIVCAVGYSGGIAQLVEDLGQEGYRSSGEGFAAYELGGDDVYFQAVGAHVAFAFEPSLLAVTSNYVQKEIVGVANDAPDIYSVAKPGRIFADARQEIDEFLGELESEMAEGAKDGPGAEYSAASAKSTREAMESFAELKKVEMSAHVGAKRTKLTYRSTAKKGTATKKQYDAAAAAPSLDTALLEGLPDDAFMVGAMTFDFANLADDPWMQSYMTMMSAMTTADGTNMGELMRTFFQEWGEVMAGPVAMAVFSNPKSAGAVAASYTLKPGADARGLMRRFVEKYPLAKMMPAYSDYMKATFKKDAFKVGGVRADTYTFAPTKKVLGDMPKDADFAKLKKSMGKTQMVMAYAQKGDRLFWVLTTNNAKAALGKMMAAAEGKGSLGKFGAAKKLVKKHADGSSLLMVDVAGMLDWVRSLKVVDNPSELPNIGGALDDVLTTGRMTKRGKREYEMSLSQDFIDQLRNL